jgi:hypothetical protein
MKADNACHILQQGMPQTAVIYYAGERISLE